MMQQYVVSPWTRGSKMNWPFAALLAVVLAGCAETGNFDQERPVKRAGPVEPIVTPAKPVSPKSSLAKAEASKAETNEHSALLMRCVSEACKTQCSSGLEKSSRPKWCMYFKEPDDRHASEMPGKSTE
jgi:hypothetical protein